MATAAQASGVNYISGDAGWAKKLISVRWDADGLVRRVHRKRVEKV